MRGKERKRARNFTWGDAALAASQGVLVGANQYLYFLARERITPGVAIVNTLIVGRALALAIGNQRERVRRRREAETKDRGRGPKRGERREPRKVPPRRR